MSIAAHRNIETSNQSETDTENLRRGRPRSEEARKAILDATRRLLTHTSLSGLSIEAIAKKAGVGKTTIYRWWPNKAAIAMETLTEQAGLKHIVPTTTSAGEAIIRQLESMGRQLRGQNGQILAGIIAEGQSDPEIADMLYEHYLKDRIETLYSNIELGKKNGEFKANLDSDIAIDMLVGPLFLRVLSGEEAMDTHFIETYPQQAVLAISA